MAEVTASIYDTVTLCPVCKREIREGQTIYRVRDPDEGFITSVHGECLGQSGTE